MSGAGRSRHRILTAALTGCLAAACSAAVLIAVGGYRSTSMLINSAGVQLDDNMADFRFPPALR